MPRRNEEAEDECAVTFRQVLDENFECMSRMAKGICRTLGRPKDRSICRNMLSDLAKFNKSLSVEVKLRVHKFMAFYLQVLRWTQAHQLSTIYERWYGSGFKSNSEQHLGSGTEMRIWLEQGRSYLAMKHFPDGSAIIYSAVAHDPLAGWADNGFTILGDQFK